jgi:hypothetical protein
MIMTYLLMLICISSNLMACNVDEGSHVKAFQVDSSNSSINANSMLLKISIGSNIFNAKVYNNATATAFIEKLPMTINMKELNGNEKYSDLPDNLPTNASNPGTIQAGDLMLYGSNTLVLFYKTFSTSYNYTRIARIENPSGLSDALDSGNITVKFELE